MRINATLRVSRLQKRSEVAAFLMVVLLLILSEMPLWSKAFALILMSAFAVHHHLLKKPTERLTQLIQFDKDHWQWSVLEPHRIQKTKNADGRLVSVQGGLVVFVLRLETTVKNKSVIQNCVIWRDQVDADNWRRLVVISRFWSTDVQRIID